jgi:hypothetical protein
MSMSFHPSAATPRCQLASAADAARWLGLVARKGRTVTIMTGGVR